MVLGFIELFDGLMDSISLCCLVVLEVIVSLYYLDVLEVIPLLRYLFSDLVGIFLYSLIMLEVTMWLVWWFANRSSI